MSLASISIETAVHPETGLEVVHLSDGAVRVSVVPAVGAKITSFTSLRSGAEYVWQDPTRPVLAVPAGAGYGDADASGIDDCFPTVDPCAYPDEPFTGVPIGDHGDLWPVPWSWSATPDSLDLQVSATNLPYRLTRSLSFDAPGSLLLGYRLESLTDAPLLYQWTAHPLLRCEPGLRIGLNQEQECRPVFAAGGRITPTGPWPWPSAPGPHGTVDMSVAPGPETAVNEKFWTTMPRAGCRLEYPSTGERLRVTSDLEWLALCVDYGGWPETSPGYWVAPEASTSCWDALSDSVERGTHRTLAPRGTDTWWWRLALEPAD